MGLTRSTFYDASPATLPDDGILARIGTIGGEFECYGYRRVGAALRHQGIVVNGTKLRRLMREHDLQPKQRRRYAVTTDSDHAGLIYPDLAKDVVPERPNQLWLADLTEILSANSDGLRQCCEAGHARFGARPSVQPVHDAGYVLTILHYGGHLD